MKKHFPVTTYHDTTNLCTFVFLVHASYTFDYFRIKIKFLVCYP
jgi:hypothetical protein